MPLVSIIVPVYKTERFLCRCVDSIVHQTYNSLEIILVDDGSPDRCPLICDNYAAKDNRIKVIHKSNAGVSAARNTGLACATGDYISFVDSDDYIEPDMYESMLMIADKYDCDFILCDCVKDFKAHSEIYSHNIRAGFYNQSQMKEEYYPHLLMMENVEYPATISNCLCLFRRELLKNKSTEKIYYLEGVRFSEDLLFGAQIIYNTNSFYYMKEQAFYHYVMNNNSTTHIFTEDKWNDYLKLYNEAEHYFLKIADYDFRHQLDLMLLFFVYNYLGDVRCSALPKKEKILLKQNVHKNVKVKEMFKRIKVLSLPIHWKLKVRTIGYRIGL